MRLHPSLGPLAASTAGAVGWCLILGGSAGGDPMLLVEAVIGSAISLWTFCVALELAAARRVERALVFEAIPAVIGGVPCRLTHALGTDAAVVGVLRPRIYVGFDLVRTLSHDEMKAVLYHEDHHRLTRAPLRAAALTGWLRLFGRATPVRRMVLDRLADLETMADTEAMRRGSTPGSLARALLKGDEPIGRPAAFSYAAERRVEQLLRHVAGAEPAGNRRLPYEWLPVAMFVVAAVGCHLAL